MDVIRRAREQGVRIVDVEFTDLLGTWQHFSLPLEQLGGDAFEEGLGFDGSSIRGFQEIHESDMLLVPDPSTAFVDPVLAVPTLSLLGDIVDPTTGAPYSRDPRYVARKAEAYLPGSGVATTSYWGPEAEFYIFDSLRFDQGAHHAHYEIDSEEGIWNSGRNGTPSLAYRPRVKEGYFPVPPTDKLQDLRSEIALKLADAGVEVEVHHHEVGAPGQTEIDLRFATLVRMADRLQTYKYIVKNVCAARGKVATFMPKPVFGDNGSGMHVHQSLWREGASLFWDETGYAQLSEIARWETGFTQAKNAAHTITMNFMVYAIGLLAYWAVGFALQGGGVGPLATLGGYDMLTSEYALHVGGHRWGLFGHTGFFLTGVAYSAPVFAYFLFQMVFMDTAATIPTGAMAER